MKYLRFGAAIIVGLIGSALVKDGPVTIRGIISMLKALARPERAPAGKVACRLAACERCVIYYKPLRTCGTPLRNGEDRLLGCWCDMEVKATLETAGCWLRDEKGSLNGWSSSL